MIFPHFIKILIDFARVRWEKNIKFLPDLVKYDDILPAEPPNRPIVKNLHEKGSLILEFLMFPCAQQVGNFLLSDVRKYVDVKWNRLEESGCGMRWGNRARFFLALKRRRRE